MKKKHIKMIKIFLGILFNKNEIINLVIPDSYKKSVKEIDYDKLNKLGLNNLIFDIDNTIAKVDDINMEEDIIMLFQNLKKNGFNIIVMSNNNKSRVIPISEKLNVPYLCDAKKPNKEAFDEALSILKCEKSNAVMIGDQMLTDIVGANESEIYSVLVDQISNENNIQTGIAKFLQNMIVKKMKKKKLFTYGDYY